MEEKRKGERPNGMTMFRWEETAEGRRMVIAFRTGGNHRQDKLIKMYI